MNFILKAFTLCQYDMEDSYLDAKKKKTNETVYRGF